ncbi:MAG: ArsR family transcriptional regulator, partial [Chloroflexi bacterium]|nr:ArsR family transcriptional regulator [Chloroflexota bacterium]
MNDVRQHILNILKERGQATVADLAAALKRAPVSVRHHLDILQKQELIRMAGVQRRSSRG